MQAVVRRVGEAVAAHQDAGREGAEGRDGPRARRAVHNRRRVELRQPGPAAVLERRSEDRLEPVVHHVLRDVHDQLGLDVVADNVAVLRRQVHRQDVALDDDVLALQAVDARRVGLHLHEAGRGLRAGGARRLAGHEYAYAICLDRLRHAATVRLPTLRGRNRPLLRVPEVVRHDDGGLVPAAVGDRRLRLARERDDAFAADDEALALEHRAHVVAELA